MKRPKPKAGVKAKARARGSNEVLRKMFKERQKASAICENKPKKRDVHAAEVAERN